jgi:translin|tara:strand:+ start:2169 stop:2741 length:573 start_codon:yes stop_codon:yes gene_type:complete
MLNTKEFGKIRKELAAFEAKRELVIRQSRDIINLSKRIIYALHRDDIKTASSLVKDIEKKKTSLEKISIDADTNIDKVAIQEYVEAICYYHFIKNKKIPATKAIKVDNESYLLGLCDLTGELVRKAVNEVINKNFKAALEIKNLVEEIFGEFLKFNLRNGELRKKSDQIKWNLKKLEDVVYELKLKGKLK